MKNPQHEHDAKRLIDAVLKYNLPAVAAPKAEATEAEELEDMVRRLPPAERERFQRMLDAGQMKNI